MGAVIMKFVTNHEIIENANMNEIIAHMKSNHKSEYENLIENLTLCNIQLTPKQIVKTHYDVHKNSTTHYFSPLENIENIIDNEMSNELYEFYETHDNNHNLTHAENITKTSLSTIRLNDVQRAKLSLDKNCIVYASYIDDVVYAHNIKTKQTKQIDVFEILATSFENHDIVQPHYMYAIAMTNQPIADYIVELHNEIK